MEPRRVFTPKRKAQFLAEFDALPEGRTGERRAFMKKNRLSWGMFNRWRKEDLPKVEASANGSFPAVRDGVKRLFTPQEKMEILRQYDALTFGSKERAVWAKKYGFHHSMLKRWKAEVKSWNNGATPKPRGGARKGAGRRRRPPSKTLLSKLSGDQIVQLLREQQRAENKAFESVISNLEDLLK